MSFIPTHISIEGELGFNSVFPCTGVRTFPCSKAMFSNSASTGLTWSWKWKTPISYHPTFQQVNFVWPVEMSLWYSSRSEYRSNSCHEGTFLVHRLIISLSSYGTTIATFHLSYKLISNFSKVFPELGHFSESVNAHLSRGVSLVVLYPGLRAIQMFYFNKLWK